MIKVQFFHVAWTHLAFTTHDDKCWSVWSAMIQWRIKQTVNTAQGFIWYINIITIINARRVSSNSHLTVLHSVGKVTTIRMTNILPFMQHLEQVLFSTQSISIYRPFTTCLPNIAGFLDPYISPFILYTFLPFFASSSPLFLHSIFSSLSLSLLTTFPLPHFSSSIAFCPSYFH